MRWRRRQLLILHVRGVRVLDRLIVRTLPFFVYDSSIGGGGGSDRLGDLGDATGSDSASLVGGGGSDRRDERMLGDLYEVASSISSGSATTLCAAGGPETNSSGSAGFARGGGIDMELDLRGGGGGGATSSSSGTSSGSTCPNGGAGVARGGGGTDTRRGGGGGGDSTSASASGSRVDFRPKAGTIGSLSCSCAWASS